MILLVLIGGTAFYLLILTTQVLLEKIRKYNRKKKRSGDHEKIGQEEGGPEPRSAFALKGNRMKRNIGIITILVGVGLLFISIIFSSGYHPQLNFIGNISRMEIVLNKGKYVPDFDLHSKSTGHYGHYEGGIAIPLKYPLSFSVVLILLGTGVVLISKNKKSDA